MHPRISLFDAVLATEEDLADELVSKIKTWHWIVLGMLQIAVAVLGNVADLDVLEYFVVPGLAAICSSITTRKQTG